jgi:hypothetical protein
MNQKKATTAIKKGMMSMKVCTIILFTTITKVFSKKVGHKKLKRFTGMGY